MNRRLVRSVVRIVALAIGATDWQARRAAGIAASCLAATADPVRAIRSGLNACRTLRRARRPQAAPSLQLFRQLSDRVQAMRLVGGTGIEPPRPAINPLGRQAEATSDADAERVATPSAGGVAVPRLSAGAGCPAQPAPIINPRRPR